MPRKTTKPTATESKLEKPKKSLKEESIEEKPTTQETKATKPKLEKTPYPYTLIISEKPNSAKRIAQALSEKAEKISDGNVSFYELVYKGEKIRVASAVGHLFTLQDKSGGWTYPAFNVEWTPSYQASESSRFTKAYFDMLQKLAKNATMFINGCDLDREGELIFRNVLRFICGKEDGKRMRFSTLTKDELIQAYENAAPHIDFGLAEAGEARHIMDYFWGISVSRALTIALRDSGGYKVLSTGRVQGPTLEILTKREQEIGSFKPDPFWEILSKLKFKDQVVEAPHEKGKFEKKEEAEAIFKKCKGKPAAVDSVDKKEYKQAPPTPFDLTTLQRESYNNFGFSPKRTLDIAQTLYEAALISYPRTSSQKLPAKLGWKAILQQLAKNKNFEKQCEQLLAKPNLKPNEGPKEDPAHPSIYPTGLRPDKLNVEQAKLYDLIVKRFLAVFGEPAIRESLKVGIKIEGEKFIATGVRTIKANWIDLYKPYSKFKEALLPEIKKGDKPEVVSLDLLEKQTQPPKRYTQASILKKLEDLNLGTKGTRASILQTLYDRGYIQDQTITVTELGKSVIHALEAYCPEIVSVELTGQFEKEMELIDAGKSKKEKIIDDAKKSLTEILEKFKKNQKEIGKELLKGMRSVMKAESYIGKCQSGGNLEIKTSMNNKQFVGCSDYPKCTQTYPLPQKGRIFIQKTPCPKCGLSILSIRQYKKRPWNLCVKDGFVNISTKKPKSEDSEKPQTEKEETESV